MAALEEENQNEEQERKAEARERVKEKENDKQVMSVASKAERDEESALNALK